VQEPQQSMAILLPVARIFDDAVDFEVVTSGFTFGSVELGETGRTALLYTNASDSERLTLLDLELEANSGIERVLDLKLPIFSAVTSPDGAHAIVLLRAKANSAKPGAFAVVPIEQDLPFNITGTLAPTVPLAGTDAAMVAIDDARALVTASDAKSVHVAYLVRLPELVVDAVELASRPLPHASGIVPEANRAFVAQQHPEGRITFIDLDTSEQHTLTGFELSKRVADAE
jgi:hypothetical protein